jgi:Fe-S cluster assembly protein SufB
MIKISKLADYATVILSWLAKHPKQAASTNQIAEGTRLPVPTVRKVLKILNEARLVTSARGTQGGYALSREPKDIRIADIVYAIDGEVSMTECSRESVHSNCSRHQFCGLRHNWQYINYLVFSLLRELNLADMDQPLHQVLTISLSREAKHE